MGFCVGRAAPDQVCVSVFLETLNLIIPPASHKPPGAVVSRPVDLCLTKTQ